MLHTKSSIAEPLITVAVPSLNQGQFLDVALQSIFDQGIPVQVMVMDAGSTDNSIEIINKWESHIAWWRSSPDSGQAAAINEGIARGTAPYVCWLNSDDLILSGGLKSLVKTLNDFPEAAAAYGKCLIIDENGHKKSGYWTVPFQPKHLANRCFIAQPASLIRRTAWESVGGLDESLHMSLDYDLWWKLYRLFGSLQYVQEFVAASRTHADTKTMCLRKEHYRESMQVVRQYTGSVPLKWYLAWPLRVNLWKFHQAIKQLF